MAPYSFSLRVMLFVVAVAGSLLSADFLVPRSILTALPGARSDLRQRSSFSSDQIVLLGDSTIRSVDPGDTDRRSIAVMLSELSNGRVADRSHGAFSQDEFYSQIEAIVRSGRIPRAVIVPINLRSFSPHWERNPYWQFSDFEVANRYNLYVTLRALNVLQWRTGVSITAKEYSATQVVVNGHVIGLLGDPKNNCEVPLTLHSDGIWTVDRKATLSTVVRVRALSRYGTDLEQSESFFLLKKNLALAEQAEIPMLFYITPIDWEYLTGCLAEEEIALIEHNLLVLRRTLSDSGVRWIDLSVELKHEAFDHPDDQPHEHLNQNGRQHVAHELKRSLMSLRSFDKQ